MSTNFNSGRIKIFWFYFRCVFLTEPFFFFAKFGNQKCLHTTKKCMTDIFSFFRCDFCKEFSVKKLFSCHPLKAVIRADSEWKWNCIWISTLSCQTNINTDEEKLLLLVAFNSRHRSTFPWSRYPSYTSSARKTVL